MIYLDNNATTQVAPEVLDVMLPLLADEYGNPSSAHELGRSARDVVETASASVAALLGAEAEEIYFTSGGTESDNWAVRVGRSDYRTRSCDNHSGRARGCAERV